ncbi:MAG: aminodeoxychorismate lyase [Pseudomonadota bacterium]
MSKPDVAVLDGRPLDEPWLIDRGLHYGDGLFETMRVCDGRIRFVALHRERLQRGCSQLQIAADVDDCFAQAQALVHGVASAMLKLIVTRGSATARGYAPHGDEQPRRILLRYDDPATRDVKGGPGVDSEAISLRTILGENPQLAGLKHLNRLELVLARLEMHGSTAFEGLLCSSSGLVISGTMSNMFIVAGNELLTPRLDRCGIAGVLRTVVLREAAGAGFAAREIDVPQSALATAEEIFLTNARIGVHPLGRLDGRALRTSEATTVLRQRVAVLDA